MILYKYCDQLGGLKILASRELRIPYVSDLNDPHDCWPYIVCSNDSKKIKAHITETYGEEPNHSEFEMHVANGVIQKNLLHQNKILFQKVRSDACMISVSETACEPVMWAHYAEKHKGVVIGFDFKIFFNHQLIKGPNLNQVRYAHERPVVDITEHLDAQPGEGYAKTVLTKSLSWNYEKEYRCIIHEAYLRKYEAMGIARHEGLIGKPQWYLKIYPGAIREVIFGTNTEDGLKNSIKKIIKQSDFSELSLLEVQESKSYLFNLNKLQN